jgi:glutamate-1-semialdehyde 2,1-aminomutase
MGRKQATSAALYEKAKQYFPGGVNSPVRAFKSVGGTPVFMQRGDGSHIWDADGNEYIDYCCSWGPLIHGHNHPHIRRAIIEAVELGTSFGAPTQGENLLAETILEHHSYIKKLRFVSSGTEAVMSALRLARGATGRNKIIKFEGCYHGHVDALLVKAGSGLVTLGTGSSAGVPEAFAQQTLVVPLGDKAAIEAAFETWQNDIAAVIIEPVPANNGLLLQEVEFLQFLRNKCSAHGSLLIFDEVISGFRIGFEGAAGYFNITPDIITFGKIIGGGMPVGAYAASHALMTHIAPEGPVYQAGTLSGNPVAMAAGKAALELCLEGGFYDQLSLKTKYLSEEITAFAKSLGIPFSMPHIGSIFWLSFSDSSAHKASEIDASGMTYFNRLYALLLDNGVYFGPSGYEVGFMSAAHSEEDLTRTLQTFKKVLPSVLEK